ncbi:MAG: type III pantothenate kinase [Burkholderiales bacterium]|nr:type III pantothenate kinase [Burkholderiales bacterium]
MMLAIDAGNTRIKWGKREAGAWIDIGSCATGERGSLAKALGSSSFERILVANVAGSAVRSSIEQALGGRGSTPQFLASRAAQCGVRSGYDDPAQLGCDRWAALIGAHRLYPGTCLVVNAGTALTVDALTEEGLFLGGIIVPGIALMRRALDEHTAGLALQPGAVRFFPANTGDAITSGAVHAAAGAIERMASFMRESGHDALRVVLSGGNARELRPLLGLDTLLVEHLVLEGIAAIAEEGD